LKIFNKIIHFFCQVLVNLANEQNQPSKQCLAQNKSKWTDQNKTSCTPFLAYTKTNRLTMKKNRQLHTITITASITLTVMFVACTTQFRVLRYGYPDIDDRTIFVNDTIQKGNVAFPLPVSLQLSNALDTIQLNHPINKNLISLAEYLRLTQTKAFLIIQNDTLVHEKYFDGYTRSSIHCTFSVSKSITSLIAGAAFEQIPDINLDEPITTFVPALVHKHPYFQQLSINDLFAMKSGLSYSNFRDWTDVFCDNNMIYYSKNQKKYISNENFKFIPGEKRQYKSYDPILIAWMIEQVTNQKVADFFSEAVWKKMGAEYDAYWSVDQKNGLIKASSSFHCSAIDLAKIGLLLLKEGKLKETQIIPSAWIKNTVGTAALRNQKPVLDTWWKPAQCYFWWYSTIEPVGDYYADGYKGQFLYVNPNTNTVIVKFSNVGDEFHDMPFRGLSTSVQRVSAKE
jgi:CubicO group peptidase (beta-lactamase class C family)